ncbi:hypothetical protein SPHFLASMR4Y_00223 [Sphingorhabdus sp. SMR4y]|nr:hypothetical protein SPHFLASMR4Y_00223 [Sphingorhabdus sp. SMR4y]
MNLIARLGMLLDQNRHRREHPPDHIVSDHRCRRPWHISARPHPGSPHREPVARSPVVDLPRALRFRESGQFPWMTFAIPRGAGIPVVLPSILLRAMSLARYRPRLRPVNPVSPYWLGCCNATNSQVAAFATISPWRRSLRRQAGDWEEGQSVQSSSRPSVYTLSNDSARRQSASVESTEALPIISGLKAPLELPSRTHWLQALSSQIGQAFSASKTASVHSFLQIRRSGI